jgi:hypothetical protein
MDFAKEGATAVAFFVTDVHTMARDGKSNQVGTSTQVAGQPKPVMCG